MEDVEKFYNAIITKVGHDKFLDFMIITLKVISTVNFHWLTQC